jgi:site-specific DNA recombinase
MGNTIGYIRVSTTLQAEQGVSLEAQSRKIMSYCDLHELELIEIVEDSGLSGKTISGRPGIQKILDLVKSRKIKNVVILKLDRLARNLKEACEISDLMQKKDVALHSISERIDTGSATGKLFYHIISAMAEWERGVISERTVTAMSVKKSKGERVSRHAPYGFMFIGDNIVENDKEQEVIGIVKYLTSQGYSISGIIGYLENHGYSNRRGHRFGVKEVWSLRKAA